MTYFGIRFRLCTWSDPSKTFQNAYFRLIRLVSDLDLQNQLLEFILIPSRKVTTLQTYPDTFRPLLHISELRTKEDMKHNLDDLAVVQISPLLLHFE